MIKVPVNKKGFIPKEQGFTLVEMLISVSLFVIVTFLSLGALLTVFDGNRKSQASKTVVDNLNMTLENMTRNIRFGNTYYCGVVYSSTARDCTGGNTGLWLTFEGVRMAYKFENGAIKKADDGVNFKSLTSPDTTIEDMQFYVKGAEFTAGEYVQPYVIVMIKGYVGKKPSVKTSFIIQTLISQRKLDL